MLEESKYILKEEELYAKEQSSSLPGRLDECAKTEAEANAPADELAGRDSAAQSRDFDSQQSSTPVSMSAIPESEVRSASSTP